MSDKKEQEAKGEAKQETVEGKAEIVEKAANLEAASESEPVSNAPEDEDADALEDGNASDNASVDSYDSHDPNSQYYDPENGFRKQPIEEVRVAVKDMEQCYLEARTELKEMAEMVAKYKSLKAKCNKLGSYWFYQGPWTVYMERMEQECPDEKYEIHGESALFDLSHEFDDLTLELLRESALEVAKDA